MKIKLENFLEILNYLKIEIKKHVEIKNYKFSDSSILIKSITNISFTVIKLYKFIINCWFIGKEKIDIFSNFKYFLHKFDYDLINIDLENIVITDKNFHNKSNHINKKNKNEIIKKNRDLYHFKKRKNKKDGSSYLKIESKIDNLNKYRKNRFVIKFDIENISKKDEENKINNSKLLKISKIKNKKILIRKEKIKKKVKKKKKKFFNIETKKKNFLFSVSSKYSEGIKKKFSKGYSFTEIKSKGFFQNKKLQKKIEKKKLVRKSLLTELMEKLSFEEFENKKINDKNSFLLMKKKNKSLKSFYHSKINLLKNKNSKFRNYSVEENFFFKLLYYNSKISKKSFLHKLHQKKKFKNLKKSLFLNFIKENQEDNIILSKKIINSKKLIKKNDPKLNKNSKIKKLLSLKMKKNKSLFFKSIKKKLDNYHLVVIKTIIEKNRKKI